MVLRESHQAYQAEGLPWAHQTDLVAVETLGGHLVPDLGAEILQRQEVVNLEMVPPYLPLVDQPWEHQPSEEHPEEVHQP